MLHKGKLILGIITAIVVLFAIIEIVVISKEETAFLCIFISCGILIGYADVRWTLGYLEKHPGASWRRLPTLGENEPVLNVYCLNFYKWLIILSIAFFMSMKL